MDSFLIWIAIVAVAIFLTIEMRKTREFILERMVGEIDDLRKDLFGTIVEVEDCEEIHDVIVNLHPNGICPICDHTQCLNCHGKECMKCGTELNIPIKID